MKPRWGGGGNPTGSANNRWRLSNFLLHPSIWTPRLMTNPNYFFGPICLGKLTSNGSHQLPVPLRAGYVHRYF